MMLVFQKYINKILYKKLDFFVIIYLSNIPKFPRNLSLFFPDNIDKTFKFFDLDSFLANFKK